MPSLDGRLSRLHRRGFARDLPLARSSYQGHDLVGAQQFPQWPADPELPSSSAYGKVFHRISITDSTAHLGDNYVNHIHYHNDSEAEHTLDQLSKLIYREVHRQFQESRLEAAGHSLLDSDEYRQWRDMTMRNVQGASSTHCFWIDGPPGVGKSFVASSVVDNLYERTRGTPNALAFLYARRDRSFEQTVSTCLRSTARQMLECLPRPALTRYLPEVKRHNQTNSGQSALSINDLLLALTTEFQHTYVVLDALDEFSETPDDRIHLLESLKRFQKGAAPGSIRLLITSRQSQECFTVMRPLWRARIAPSRNSLEAFVHHRIRQSSRLAALCPPQSHLSKKVTEAVLNGCGGVSVVCQS